MKVTNSSSSRLLLALTCFLAFAVFFWGLHDKASLYKSTPGNHPIAKAKLLSGRELASDAVNVSAPEPPAEPGLLAGAYFAAMTLLFSIKLRESGRYSFLPDEIELPGLTNPLHRRPPPSKALLPA